MNNPRHPILGLAASFALLTSSAGCELAPSFHLPAQREQLTTDPNAVGLWFAEEEDALAFYRVSSPTEDTAWHRVEIFGGECDQPASLDVAIAAIDGDERILILTSDVDGIAIPVYWTGRLWLEEERAKVAFLDGEWLSKYLLENPSSLTHIRRIYDQGDPFFDSDVLITASADEVHRFLREHRSSEDAWFESELTKIDRTRALELAQEWGCAWPRLDEDADPVPDPEEPVPTEPDSG